MVRITTRILIPVSPDSRSASGKSGSAADTEANETVQTIEGKYQDLAMGPVAALESIKHLGTNGGGFFGANSTTPFENPDCNFEYSRVDFHDDPSGSLRRNIYHMIHDNRREKQRAKQ
ncbi:MAG: potassium-transporting ATPase subunit KdpA [Mediterraneibacter gnavus]